MNEPSLTPPSNDSSEMVFPLTRFMEQVGFDVFQFILSYLPPIPYLFQLQRVNQHWKYLCCECMKEDCTELYWDLSTISGLKCKGFLGKVEDKLPHVYQYLHVGESNDVRGLGFLRIILSHFKKVKRMTLKNMKISVGVLHAIFVEWRGRVKELCFIDCNIDSVNLGNWFRFKFDSSETFQNSYGFVNGRHLREIEISVEPEYGQPILDGLSRSELETIILRNCSSTSGYYYDMRCLFGELMGLLKCFLPHLKYVDTSNLSPSTDMDKLIEELDVKRFFPNVVFQKNVYTIACQMIKDGIDYHEVMRCYFDYFVSEFKFRRNRLIAYASRHLSNFSEFSQFHKFVAKPLLTFFSIHSPFGIDTDQQDIQGYNIIQLALMHANTDVLTFILEYLTCLENSTETTSSQQELQQLFSHNNKLDGKNAIFSCMSQGREQQLLTLLHKYKISLNHQALDGNTVAHYLCHFGQLQRMKFILEKVLELDTDHVAKKSVNVSEVKYFIDFDIRNNEGETPLDLCNKYKMHSMYSYLKDRAKQLGISHVPQYTFSTSQSNNNTQQASSPDQASFGVVMASSLRSFKCCQLL
ncbi:hypothetical protein C9374_011792 [Naegleria lovaniensis]|uniref:F-box domain-containing protein n=1 Tax=Naegleria lovaniensis TaxID=51637 RepID=A0AA88GEF9_NAELO|nr:uncharacterized protein C9374_011792 [Naegleria lovaniensis]KAG2373703.1 hypothetical protein C9374_011792 [Naegleria lovaniensis]